MLISSLLRFAAQPDCTSTSDNVVDALVRADHKRVQWALDAGLGPMLFRATRQVPGARLPASLEQQLLSAELTARVRHAAQVTTVLDVLDVCGAVGAPATLLKGISISEQCYERPHERAMTDIDVLVPQAAASAVEAEALRRGYEHGLPVMGPDPHHGEPLVHPQTRIKIEIHTALFQSGSRLRMGNLFETSAVHQRSLEFTFLNRPVRRLPTDLQLVYIASYWVNNLCNHPLDHSFTAPLIDAVNLLRNTGAGFDWDRLVASLDNELATAALYVLLVYLSRRGHIRLPHGIIDALQERQRIVGSPELGILLAVIDRYIVGGQRFGWFNSWHLWRNLLEPGLHSWKLLKLPWRIAFPPTYANRFDAEAQTRRLMRWLTQ